MQDSLLEPTALIICSSHLHKDPRVLRQISWLRDDYQVTTAGYSPSGIEGVDHIPFESPPRSSLMGKISRAAHFFSREYETFYWNAARIKLRDALSDRNFQLIVANDYDTLPIANHIKGQNTTLLFDAHEYSPLEFTDNLRWRFLQQPLIKYICREYIPRTNVRVTVCRSVADKYEREYGVRFDVVTNAAGFEDLQPSKTDPAKIRIIYHGVVSQSRQTHKQIEMMKYLDDRFELNLMILGEPDYIEGLKRMSAPLNNIRFLPPVETKEIARFTNSFDIGLFLLPPTNFNYLYALPNKFFEFVQARLAVAVSPSPEMAAIARERDLGIVASDFEPESMAKAINDLTVKRIDHFKAQAHKHARDLSAEQNRKLFLELIESSDIQK